MVNTGQQQRQQPADVGILVQGNNIGSSQRGGGRYSFGGGGGSQERDLGTPPLAAKPPRLGPFGGRARSRLISDPDDTLEVRSDRKGNNSNDRQQRAASTLAGDDHGDPIAANGLVAHDSDVELDRLWDRFNSLKGEIPATSNTPPPAELNNSPGVSGNAGARRTGAGGGEGRGENDASTKSSRDEEQEAWAHRREIAGKLEDIQRALAGKAEDGRRRQDELEGLHKTIEELEAYVELEASKRLEAECRAQNLEAGLQVLADRCDIEIAARETAESAAKRYMDLIAEARAAWQKTQDIVQNKEKELAAAESRGERGGGGGGADSGSLQRRLEDARREKEMDRQHSASLKLALEGGRVCSSPGGAVAAAVAAADGGDVGVSSPKAGRRHGSAGSLVDVRGGDAEWRAARTREGSPSAAASPRLSLDPDRVAAAEARLQAAIDEAAAAAAATPSKSKEASPQQPKQSRAPRRRQWQRHRQQQQQQQRGDCEKTAARPRIVPLTKDRPELGGGDIYRSLGGSYHVATPSINDSGGSGGGGGDPCTYSGTGLNHDRYPKEASYVNDYFSAGGDERSGMDGADVRYGESRPCRGQEKDASRRPGVCRETMVKLKGTVGTAVVKAMNDGGKNMKVPDSKRGTELIAALCSISSGFAF